MWTLWNLLEKLPRGLLPAVAFWLPAERRRRAERWLRGFEQSRKLARADAVVVSFGKSGRTWLRVLLSRFYQTTYGLAGQRLLGFDNLHRRNRAIPRVFFTHDNYLADYTGNADSKRDFYGKRVVLLVRAPQDVMVSQYFQWKFRMRARKKALNDYPPHGADVSLAEFAMHEGAGLPRVVRFLNQWAREIGRLRDVRIVRYEDLRADPVATFGRIVDFLGGPDDEAAVRDAVAYASVENMRELERRRVFWLSGGRMTARDRGNPDSYKVRRAKVGGYRDYFDDAQAARLDAFVAAELSPIYGYGRRVEPAASPPAIGAAAEAEAAR